MNEKKLITKDMTIGEAVTKFPQTTQVFFSYGLPCAGCRVSQWESVEEGAIAHGIKDINSLIKDLNKVAEKAEIK